MKNIKAMVLIWKKPQEKEVDKTYHPRKLSKKEQEKQEENTKKLEEFLAKDKPIIEALWKERQKKMEEFNKIWSKK